MIEESLRVDKNLAYNILELQKYEDKQTQIIIKSLLIYFSFSYQTDLFGYGTLDPKDFANKMGLDYSSLFRKHPNPKQILNSPYSAEKLYEQEKINGSFSDSRLWDSYLENAIFILSTAPLFENYKGATGNRDFIGITNYILIRDRRISFITANNGRRKKILYHYMLDEIFERNLRRFFLQAKFENYLLSKNKGVEDFYLTLSNIYQTNKYKGITKYRWALKEILVYFNISSNLEIRFQKSKLNAKLKIVANIMADEIPNITFGWDKGEGQRYSYVPYVTWRVTESKQLKNNDFKTLDSVFYKHLKRNLYDIYKTQDNKQIDPINGYYSWLWDDDSIEVKIACYISTYSLHNKISKYPKPSVLARVFFTETLKKAKNGEDIDKCFSVQY